MRSAFLPKLAMVLLGGSVALAGAQVNPHTQITWPVDCANGGSMVYNVLLNDCVAAGINWRGIWDPAITYDANDAVSYLGAGYISTSSGNTATPPAAPWTAFIQSTFNGGTVTNPITAPGFVGPLTGHASLDLPLTGGTLSGSLTASGFVGPLTGNASLDLPLAGGTLTGALSGTSASFTGTVAAPIFATSLTQLKGIAASSTNTPAILYGVGTTDDQVAKLYSWQVANCTSADDDVQVQPGGTGCWVRYSASTQMQGLATSAHFGIHNVACGIDSLSAGAGAPSDSSCWQLRKILRSSNLGNGGAGWELFYQGYTISTGNQYTASFPAAVHSTTNVKQADSIASPTVWQYALAGRAYYCDLTCVPTTDYMYWTPEDAFSSANIMYEWHTSGASFTGTGAGTNLTTSAVTGTIHVADAVTGTGVPANTTIVSQTSGPAGGAGVYVTSASTTSSGAALKSGGAFNLCRNGGAACSTDSGAVAVAQGVADAGAINTPYTAAIANTSGNYNLKMEYEGGQPVWLGGNFIGNPNGVTVMNFGLGGQTMATYDTLNHTAQQQGWAVVKPDVVILKGGMNDRNTASPATFSGYMQNAINDILGGSPATRIILEASHQTGDYLSSNLSGYNIVLQALAMSNHLSFINDADAVGSYQRSVAQGWNNSADVGSGATVTCTYTNGGCSAYTVTAGGTLYTGKTYLVFKHDLSCSIYPTGNPITSAGVVISVTPLTAGICPSAPTAFIFGEQDTCNASVQTGCDVHPSPYRGTVVEAAWLADKAFGISGAYNPVAAYTIAGSTAPYPTAGTICPSGCTFQAVASGSAQQVLDLGAQQGTGHGSLIDLKISGNRTGTNLMSYQEVTFVANGTTSGPDTCTNPVALVQTSLLQPTTLTTGSGPGFAISFTYSNSRCQVVVTPNDPTFTQNITVTGTFSQGFGNTSTPVITVN